MTRLRFTLAAAALGITLAACGSDGPTAPAARAPSHRANTATDTTQAGPTTSSTPPATLPTDPTTPPPTNRGGQIVGSGG